jgi:hypothetical protein
MAGVSSPAQPKSVQQDREVLVAKLALVSWVPCAEAIQQQQQQLLIMMRRLQLRAIGWMSPLVSCDPHCGWTARPRSAVVEG